MTAAISPVQAADPSRYRAAVPRVTIPRVTIHRVDANDSTR